MSKIIAAAIIAVIGLLTVLAYRYGMIFNPTPSEPVSAGSIYDFSLKDIDGNEVKLEKFKGNVLLIVNTASRCGYTPQYEALQAVYERFKDKGFYVLGFPANNFMGQEPGSDKEIKEFCTLRYNVTFPMFSKISVTGSDQHPLYRFLTNKKTNPEFSGDITWNFNKFLISRDGKIIGRFGSKDKPDDAVLTSAIENALAEKAEK
ncbi:MAG: glutathione peroxidase [Pyrinomonadaceae bacterium]